MEKINMIKMRLVLAFVLGCFLPSGGEVVNMKIVEEPSNYGFNNYNVGIVNDEPKLKMRIKPSNFSGPPHLRNFENKCFEKEILGYKYEFCPFANVTQHEQSYRWNPFRGVLGVWQEWEIKDNKFVAMIMREGERCGDISRSTKILFECAETNEILNVTEYSKCNYQLQFSTPLVCAEHSMLVYPHLSPPLRLKWDLLQGQYQREEITRKGYDKHLKKLFIEAGYCMSENIQQIIAKSAVEQEKMEEKEQKGEFDSLYQCKEEYQKLKKEVEGLRALLAVKNDEVPVPQPVDAGPEHSNSTGV
ncbi:N-acetylglucosamine-1-phosphotransferase subunit gamma-like [Pecten maximus]|uniref:N-acetylglucosamine-1-phosphotransferase subunit gamma-like n=1 Tax=Pecten maximus TaxID=6579 RepID=UPI001457F205|nr:N-acetylglucosamine-1-phosphotransferase subunit gamma-like [Pecten maximus]XP_033752246.1 N-acetylglucosamine-1-phosphotransferase subunit gamma-like [Pecten maximus]